jgi:hypothetical protein
VVGGTAVGSAAVPEKEQARLAMISIKSPIGNDNRLDMLASCGSLYACPHSSRPAATWQMGASADELENKELP